jgi:endogenous inhibitor of DNA gyrase (YacG/DUF329 family)
MIDLGEWLSEGMRITGDEMPPEDDPGENEDPNAR